MPDPPSREEAVKELADLQECYVILLKTARRCARDLGHAIDHISDPEFAATFRSRQKNFATIFHNTSDYRLELHHDLECRERDIEQLRAHINDYDRQWKESIASRDAEIAKLKKDVERLSEPPHQYTVDDRV